MNRSEGFHVMVSRICGSGALDSSEVGTVKSLWSCVSCIALNLTFRFQVSSELITLVAGQFILVIGVMELIRTSACQVLLTGSSLCLPLGKSIEAEIVV